MASEQVVQGPLSQVQNTAMEARKVLAYLFSQAERGPDQNVISRSIREKHYIIEMEANYETVSHKKGRWIFHRIK